jgi:hypothetical protein
MATPVTTDTSFLEIRGRTDLAYILNFQNFNGLQQIAAHILHIVQIYLGRSA